MTPETEKKLLALAREIKELDRAIVKERTEKGNEGSDLRKRFYEIEEHRRILGSDSKI